MGGDPTAWMTPDGGVTPPHKWDHDGGVTRPHRWDHEGGAHRDGGVTPPHMDGPQWGGTPPHGQDHDGGVTPPTWMTPIGGATPLDTPLDTPGLFLNKYTSMPRSMPCCALPLVHDPLTVRANSCQAWL